MDETRLRYFISAVRHKSFTAAAQEHHMVTSTISRQIAALEEELGAPLFYRNAHSIELTPAGQRLYNASHGYMRQLSFIRNNARNLIHQDESRLMVGGTAYTFPLISRLTTLYRQVDPDLEVSQVHNSPDFISANMLTTDARLYVTSRSVADTLPSCQHISLGTYRWAAVSHRDNPFWLYPSEEKAMLLNQKVICSAHTLNPVRSWLEQRPTHHRGYSPGSSFTTICSQAMQDRIAILPEYMEPWLPRDLRMEHIFPDPLKVETVLIFNPDRATPLEHRFFEYIRDNFRP